MNNVKKLTALVLAAAMAASATGCADQRWSYKAGDESLTTGSYIYNLLNGYYEAYGLVESPDEAENILEVEVTGSDEDAKTKTVEQYAYDYADETSRRMIAVEDLFKSYGLVFDETQDQAARNYSSQVWTTAKKTLEGYGIGEESFHYCYADYMVKYSQVFDHLYGEDGEQYVTNEDLKKYFTENYDGYAYFWTEMTETNDEGEYVAKSDEEFKKTESQFNSYADSLNKGKDYKSVVGQYIKDYSLDSDPTFSGSLKNDDDTAIDEDVVAKIRELDEGKAAVVKTGEADTARYYVVYKPKYSEIEDYYDDDSSFSLPVTMDDEVSIYDLKSGQTRTSLLSSMKMKDFEKYLDDHAAAINIQKNEAAIKKYKAKMFVQDDKDTE